MILLLLLHPPRSRPGPPAVLPLLVLLLLPAPPPAALRVGRGGARGGPGFSAPPVPLLLQFVADTRLELLLDLEVWSGIRIRNDDQEAVPGRTVW